ncbi:MAG: DUF3179 domain-containing protein [Chloroflexota bacterium]|nr:DUF3179 domain-containing protein [Chloroflexota bacterium]
MELVPTSVPTRWVSVPQARWLGIIALALLTACGGPSAAPSPSEATASTSPVPAATGAWRTDFSRLAEGVSLDEFMRALPFRDAIPSLQQPTLATASEIDWIGDDEPVIAVERNGEWRAYPLQIMLWHEIVNDVLGDEPTVVTFCPLCHTSLVFDARLDGVPLEFGVSGYLRRSDLVMYDRQTETWWQQASGIAVVGTHAGRQLDFMPSSIIAWSEFLAAHPTAGVLDRATGHDRPYGRNPYPGWDQIRRIPPFKKGELLFCDGLESEPCIDAKERVAVVRTADETMVFPFRFVADNGGLAETDVGGVPIVVWWQPDVRTVLGNELIERSGQVGTVVAFDRRKGNDVLSFELRDGALVDRQTGTSWNVLGEATGGSLTGERLERLEVDTPYWFGFAAFGQGYRVWPLEE